MLEFSPSVLDHINHFAIVEINIFSFQVFELMYKMFVYWDRCLFQIFQRQALSYFFFFFFLIYFLGTLLFMGQVWTLWGWPGEKLAAYGKLCVACATDLWLSRSVQQLEAASYLLPHCFPLRAWLPHNAACLSTDPLMLSAIGHFILDSNFGSHSRFSLKLNFYVRS